MTMIDLPDAVIETPRVAAAADRSRLLSDVLAQVRLSGALFLKGEYSTPWAFDSPGNCALIDLLCPGAERLIVFHTVREGGAWVEAAGHRVELGPGDFAILPASHRHLVGSLAAPAEPVQIATLLPPTPWDGVQTLVYGGGGENTEMICGYFRCDELLFNAFLRSLPPVIGVRPTGATAGLLDAALTYALEDGGHMGGMASTGRVPELLLVEVLRLYSEQSPAPTGWLAATGDPVVSRALKLLHGDPARNWNVEELARRANTSRSVLGERFRALLGQSPIRYLVEWRMQLAAGLLRSTGLRLAAIAERSGYGSEAAFSRAFHRHLGMSPAQWRETALKPPSL
jgi:AraC-like DNA-binding protein